MKLNRLLLVPMVIGCLLLMACESPDQARDTASASVERGYVTDMSSFTSFIEQRPSPDAFRMRYPDLTLVLPGDVATKELRTNNSRYFAELDTQGRIVGGRFQ